MIKKKSPETPPGIIFVSIPKKASLPHAVIHSIMASKCLAQVLVIDKTPVLNGRRPENLRVLLQYMGECAHLIQTDYLLL